MDLRDRPAAEEYAEYYAGYVGHVPDGDIVQTLDRQLHETLALLDPVGEAGGDHAYGPGKWTIKEVVGHLIDAERVFAYRALRFARGDATPLPGFDQDPYVEAGRFGDRSLADLLEELATARHATVLLLRGLPDEAWARRGVASGEPVTVRALAWIMAGHELHHRTILGERYLGG